MKYRVVIPPAVEQMIRELPPVIKKQIRAGLEMIQEDPRIGKPLRETLRGLWSYRVSRYRIIYRIVSHKIEVEIIDVGPRVVIYERVLALLKRGL